ncbi:haloacid dehalogenase type II [Kineococcus sp. DHX-1]|uniref:haloacid dehalogenase type II n=1 Tax=Kineococcus sp. DHX-1 TaxID=3349638 RepID=UPI0036D3FCFA
MSPSELPADLPRPSAVVLDVNETLSDLGAVAARLASVGAGPAVAARFLPAVLRDGFARTLREDPLPFADVAADVLRTELAVERLDRPLEDAVAHVLGAFDEVVLHPDVPAGLHRFRADGVVTVALTNGGLATCEGLLERAGVREDVVHVLSVETVGPWKPHAAAYGHALDVCSLAPEEVLFVAVHPWDLDGAAGAGMRTAYLDRAGTGTYPRHATPPSVTARGLDDLAERVLRD